jgi:ABC-2 type transport system permease protein
VSALAGVSPGLRDVRGPSAFGGEPRRFWELLWLTSATEFRVRYANTFLGYVWTIVRPLIFFGVIFLVMREVLRFGEGIENYGLMLVLGLVLFQYFQEATARGVRSVSAREGMVRKMQFPRIIIPLSVSLTAAFTLFLNLLAVFPLFLISGLTPRPSWALLTIVVALLILFTTGVTMLLSVLFVRSEDTAQGWTLLSRMLFYASPVLYPIELVPESLRSIVAANPLAPLLEQARVWVVDSGAPSAVEAAGVGWGLLVPLGLLLLTCLFALWLFEREAPRVAEAL